MTNKCLQELAPDTPLLYFYTAYLYQLPSLDVQDINARFVLSRHTYQRVSSSQVL